MLTSMSEIDLGAQSPRVNRSEVGESVPLPTGTVTLLLADVEGSTGLWEIHSDEMAAAAGLLERTVREVIGPRGGVRPVEQGEGDGFVVAFARASDAVVCAVELQRASLAPIRLRIGVHTGEVQLRDEGNYMGSTMNRAARLRDLAHGGQTVLSGTAGDLVSDRLSPDTWLIDLGIHRLHGLPRPERVMQLCHSGLPNEFPPLRTTAGALQYLPVQLTSFVGREAEVAEVRHIVADNRLVTLTGAGGAGKTRLAVQIAARTAGEYGDGVWFVDFAPITDPEVVPVTLARALGLSDQPGRSTMDTITGFIADRRMLLVLDNCEHLIDACAVLVVELLSTCGVLTLLATSRERIGVPAEVTWQVPSLSLADEAIELFIDRAHRVRPDFRLTDDNAAAVTEICRRLDGMPLAIELAAARMRALSATELLDSLHDRFRVLTSGGRTAVHRQQTLRASVDWSHALLTEPERVLFRRLAVFMGSFDLDAAQFVCGDHEVQRHQVLDQLTLLIDKSLVVAENISARTRYRLLETVRQYAHERLSESDEADTIRTRHRNHYSAMAALLEGAARADHELRLARAETEIDNLRAAFAWCRENSDFELALQLVSSLQPLWQERNRIQEGLAWFDALLGDETAHQPAVPAELRARALADKTMLDGLLAAAHSMSQAEEAVAIARGTGDPALLARALTACGIVAAYHPELAGRCLAEANALARALGDQAMLGQILNFQAYGGYIVGDPIAARAAGEEGRDLAEAIGDRPSSRRCRWTISLAQWMQGELAGALTQLRDVVAEADADKDEHGRTMALPVQAQVLAYYGDTPAARAAANAAIEASALGGFLEGFSHAALATATLAAGDLTAAAKASEAASPWLNAQQALVQVNPRAQIALARGDLVAARRWADDAVSTMKGWHLAVALTTRARVALAQGDSEQADRDAHQALACATDVKAHQALPDILDCLAALAGAADSHREAARLFGAANTLRERTGAVRFKIYDDDYADSVTALRNALGETDFESAWADGAELSTDEAIAYAQRGRGERKRPTNGWASLTPTERDVVRLVSEGLTNKDIATRLFISPRTVQTHLTHVYTKLELTSRVQLAQEAARHP
ncbi:helix-turn-helix transcriptional regulator [Mycobacterium sp. BMJ-28]